MSQLTIHQFIEQNELTVEKLYIDKFWSNISEDKWIYIGDDMLTWIGYHNTESRYDKKYYCELLNNNFIENDDYKTISNSEIKESYVVLEHHIELPININTGNRTKHLIVSPDCFKASLMMMNTQRAKQIRMYYLQIEKVFRKYMKYCDEHNHKQLVDMKQSLESYKMMVINKATFKCDQYIYIATSRNYTCLENIRERARICINWSVLLH